MIDNNGYIDTQENNRLVGRGVTLTKIMLVITVAVFVIMEIMGDTTDAAFMEKCGALWTPDVIDKHELYRLIAPIFMHFGIEHLFGNVLLWYFMGDVLERALGKVKYLILFIFSGIAGNAATMAWELHTGDYAVSAGASGAIFGILGALLYLALVNKGRFEYMTIKQLLFYIVFSLIVSYETAGVNYIAHAGGLVAGFILAAILYRKREKVCDI